MKKGLFLSMFIALFLTLVAAGCSSSQETGTDNGSGSSEGKEVTNLTIRSGPTSGTWYPASGAIAEFLPKDIPGLTISVKTGAAISNVQAVQNDSSVLGFGKNASTVQGVNGEAPFEAKTEDIRNIGYLYDESFHIVVRADSGIDSIEDLEGKKLTTQVNGNLGEQMTRDVLEVYGLSYDDLANVTHVSFDDSVQQMQDGIVDAFCIGTGVPAGVLLNLQSTTDIKILEISPDKIEALQEKNGGYLEMTIPAGSYEGQNTDVKTIGSAVHLMVHNDLSEDFVYEITKSIVENREEIGKVHEAYAGLTSEVMSTDVGIPFHPGAERYFKEIGVMK